MNTHHRFNKVPDESELLAALRVGDSFSVRDNFRGIVVFWDHYSSTGELPAEWRSALNKFARDITYVIYSYDTPIALWVESPGFWIIPDVRYTRTTDGHQSQIKRLVNELGEGVYSTLDAVNNL